MLIWACDFRQNSGEGKLARLFVEKFYSKSKIEIIIVTPDCNYLLFDGSYKIIKRKKYVNYNNFFFKYLYPFIGCLFSWYSFFHGKKFIYVNYLPLWNFLLFLLFAPNTNLGPITGSNRYRAFNFRLLIPILYNISKYIVNFRHKKTIFATDNLKKYFKKKDKNKKFNFVLNYLNSKATKITPKPIDLIIYYRKHNNKNNDFMLNFALWMVDKNYKVSCIGDKINDRRVKSYGYINNKEAINLIKKSKLGVNSSENFYSFFTLDCMNNFTNVLCDKKSLNGRNIFKNKVLVTNYDNFSVACEIAHNFLKRK